MRSSGSSGRAGECVGERGDASAAERGDALVREREQEHDRTSERGSVTAEFAVLVPALLLVLGLCLSAIQLVGQHLRLTDAAADAARSAARGDDGARVAALVARTAPGAALSVRADGEFVCAELTASAGGTWGTLGLRIAATSCALGGGL